MGRQQECGLSRAIFCFHCIPNRIVAGIPRLRICGLCCILIQSREAGILNKTFVTFIVLITLALLLVNSTALHADTCDVLTCADANSDGYINLSDAISVITFVHSNGSAPGRCADFDSYDLLTFRDPIYMVRIIFGAINTFNCVEHPKLIAAPASEMSIRYEHIIQRDDTLATLRIYFTNNSDLTITDFNLPLSVRVSGLVPASIVLNTAVSTFPSVSSRLIDSTTGVIQFLRLDAPTAPGDYIICDITVRVAPSPILRHVTLEYAEFGPYMTGVFEPPNSACNYIMFLDDSLNAWRPELVPTCMYGDADNNGQWTLSDAVYLLVYIFDDRHELAETCRGDANATGSTNISDVAYLINFLVGGGPTPHCP